MPYINDSKWPDMCIRNTNLFRYRYLDNPNKNQISKNGIMTETAEIGGSSLLPFIHISSSLSIIKAKSV